MANFSTSERLALYRKMLVGNFISRPSEQSSSLTSDDITNAVSTGMAAALSKFTTQDGKSLRIADSQGWKPVGGG